MRAFLNVCRHRGSVLATGAAARETLQCPYHAWTYGLDGALKAAPRSDREPGFDCEGISLRPASVGVWGPFLFANLDPEAVLLADVLAGLPQLVADAGVDVNELRHHGRAESAGRGELEARRRELPRVLPLRRRPPGLSAPWSTSHPMPTSSFPARPSRRQFGPVRENGGGLATEGEVARSQFHFLWPNTMINIFPGRTNLSDRAGSAGGAARTERFLDYFFGPEADEEWIGELLEFDGQVGAEDKVLVENVQRGVETGLIERGRLFAGERAADRRLPAAGSGRPS